MITKYKYTQIPVIKILNHQLEDFSVSDRTHEQ